MDSTRKKKKILIISIVTLIIIIVSFIIIYNYTYEPLGKIDVNFATAYKAIIVKVNENSLGIMTTDGIPFYINYSEESNKKFKKGQQIVVYYNGETLNTEPKTIPHVGGIDIQKEKSDINIPDDILEVFNNM